MRKFLILSMLAMSLPAWSAAVPQGSHYDSHMQQVAYNQLNSTVVNTRAGYVTTLVFSDDEAVIGDPQVGFPKGWSATKEANRVYIRALPISQPVTGEDGAATEQVFLPNAKDWKTNLFITTTKHIYSIDLNVLDDDAPDKNQAFVVSWQYPAEARKADDAANRARQKEYEAEQERNRIAKAFNAAEAPRNWDYAMQVKPGSEVIAPDFAYDDGRFTYLGFSSVKKIPSPFVIVNEKEQLTTPKVTNQKNYRVLVIPSLSQKFVLRYGEAVIGLVNQGYGKVVVNNSNTVSEAVDVEIKQ